MVTIINLRQSRKQRARHAARATADANAARHGEPKALRDTRTAEDLRAARQFAAHRLDAAGAAPDRACASPPDPVAADDAD